MCLLQQNTSFVVTKVLVAAKLLCRDKHIFVATKLLSRLIFVVTNIILSQQNFCCDKLTFVVTNT